MTDVDGLLQKSAKKQSDVHKTKRDKSRPERSDRCDAGQGVKFQLIPTASLLYPIWPPRPVFSSAPPCLSTNRINKLNPPVSAHRPVIHAAFSRLNRPTASTRKMCAHNVSFAFMQCAALLDSACYATLDSQCAIEVSIDRITLHAPVTIITIKQSMSCGQTIILFF